MKVDTHLTNQPPHVIRCVLFDLDGTLVDTWDLYVEAYTRTLELSYGRRLTLDKLIELGPTSELRFFRRAHDHHCRGSHCRLGCRIVRRRALGRL